LVAAVSVIPASTARLVIRSFGPLLVLAAGLDAGTAVLGLFISSSADIASGLRSSLAARPPSPSRPSPQPLPRPD
jgi:ABC-type Mn2+/Zn2+ transport system permease subunit